MDFLLRCFFSRDKPPDDVIAARGKARHHAHRGVQLQLRQEDSARASEPPNKRGATSVNGASQDLHSGLIRLVSIDGPEHSDTAAPQTLPPCSDIQPNAAPSPPVGLRLQQARDKLVLETSPAIISVFARTGGAIIHGNPRSLEYYGDRAARNLQRDETNRHSRTVPEDVLSLVFSLEPAKCVRMLEELIRLGLWKGVVRVPHSLNQELLAAEARHLELLEEQRQAEEEEAEDLVIAPISACEVDLEWSSRAGRATSRRISLLGTNQDARSSLHRQLYPSLAAAPLHHHHHGHGHGHGRASSHATYHTGGTPFANSRTPSASLLKACATVASPPSSRSSPTIAIAHPPNRASRSNGGLRSASIVTVSNQVASSATTGGQEQAETSAILASTPEGAAGSSFGGGRTLLRPKPSTASGFISGNIASGRAASSVHPHSLYSESSGGGGAGNSLWRRGRSERTLAASLLRLQSGMLVTVGPAAMLAGSGGGAGGAVAGHASGGMGSLLMSDLSDHATGGTNTWGSFGGDPLATSTFATLVSHNVAGGCAPSSLILGNAAYTTAASVNTSFHPAPVVPTRTQRGGGGGGGGSGGGGSGGGGGGSGGGADGGGKTVSEVPQETAAQDSHGRRRLMRAASCAVLGARTLSFVPARTDAASTQHDCGHAYHASFTTVSGGVSGGSGMPSAQQAGGSRAVAFALSLGTSPLAGAGSGGASPRSRLSALGGVPPTAMVRFASRRISSIDLGTNSCSSYAMAALAAASAAAAAADPEGAAAEAAAVATAMANAKRRGLSRTLLRDPSMAAAAAAHHIRARATSGLVSSFSASAGGAAPGSPPRDASSLMGERMSREASRGNGYTTNTNPSLSSHGADSSLAALPLRSRTGELSAGSLPTARSPRLFLSHQERTSAMRVDAASGVRPAPVQEEGAALDLAATLPARPDSRSTPSHIGYPGLVALTALPQIGSSGDRSSDSPTRLLQASVHAVPSPFSAASAVAAVVAAADAPAALPGAILPTHSEATLGMEVTDGDSGGDKSTGRSSRGKVGAYGSAGPTLPAVAEVADKAECAVLALARSPSLPELRTDSGRGARCPASEPETWHEVWATAAQDPVTGQDVIILTQVDITAKVIAERHLALVMETEHRLVEQLFPRHILQYITEEWTAGAAGPGAGPCGGAGGSPLGGAAAGREQAAARWRPVVRDCSAMSTWHPEVTLLFADIKGFTPMCKEVEPKQVMALLNSLYSRYDSMLDKYGVYKVETIGDCYFVAGGLIHEDEDGMAAVRDRCSREDPLHAERVFMFAKAMLAAAQEVLMPTNGQPVEIRIGLHTGPVVSGVVGTRMPRFCLFGDTVNTASRMESSGTPGAIHASDAAFQRLSMAKGDPQWEPTGGIEVKGKGLMQTHLWRRSTVDLRHEATASIGSSTAARGIASSANDGQHGVHTDSLQLLSFAPAGHRERTTPF